MELRSASIDKIARFICGDSPLPFPYRSSSKLTAFFTGLDLDYVHHGETRNAWVRDVLTDISRKYGTVGRYANSASAMSAILKELLNPDYFDEAEEKVDFDSALAEVNKVLLQYQKEIVVDPTTRRVALASADGTFISTAFRTGDAVTKITFSPRVFEVPKDVRQRKDLVAVMMPFAGFDGIHDAIKKACVTASLECKRADDIWDNSTFLQDIFDLIYAAEIVIADFSGKNPNVMYEAGIAHTLGKHVIPITQSLEHIPSNLNGHRALLYVGANSQGLRKLTEDLVGRLTSIKSGHSLRG